MQAALAPRGDARTFLTHFVGSGLDDDRYVIQRYLSRADGDIVPGDAHGSKPKGRRKPRPAIASLSAVKRMRPARDEIIIATGIKLRNCGVQYWGYRALSRQQGNPMNDITSKRINPRESRICQDGDCVGDVYRVDDILRPGMPVYVIHLTEDWRGPKRVHDRRRIREAAAQRVIDTHPFYG